MFLVNNLKQLQGNMFNLINIKLVLITSYLLFDINHLRMRSNLRMK